MRFPRRKTRKQKKLTTADSTEKGVLHERGYDGKVFQFRHRLFGHFHPLYLRDDHPLVRHRGGQNPSGGKKQAIELVILYYNFAIFYFIWEIGLGADFVGASLQHDSVFDLRRPYDMVAMLRQESRAASLDTLKQVFTFICRKGNKSRNMKLQQQQRSSSRRIQKSSLFH